MIIKSLSRKGTSRTTIKQLLTYILNENKQQDFLYLFNLKGKSITDWTDEYMMNEKQRIHYRKNNTLILHEILSFHYLDNEKINYGKLKTITQAYIKSRCPNGMALVTAHYDKKQIHIHLAISGVDVFGKSTRISRERFHEIKVAMQEHFPELKHSIVGHGKKGKSMSEREYQLTKRNKQLSEREILTAKLRTIYKQSHSKEDFYKRIQDNGLQLYERNNHIVGIISKCKYRFSTLGFDDLQLNLLDYIRDFKLLRNNNDIQRFR